MAVAFRFPRYFRLLQWAVAGVFLGRAWQHLYWDAPYRALLWDEGLMSRPISLLLGMNWDDYIADARIDSTIQSGIQCMGGFYLLCALAAFLLPYYPRICRVLLLLGGISLIFLGALYAKEKFYLAAQFFEYSLQWGSPFLLLALHRKGKVDRQLMFWTKAAIALTFTCHGLFAMGIYPTPGYFIEMVMNILGVSQAAAIDILWVAGILDLILSVLLFLPGKLPLYALAYAVFWGFSTTIARVWAYAGVMQWNDVLLQWLHESVMRAPHFLVPLFLFMVLYRQQTTPMSQPVT